MMKRSLAMMIAAGVILTISACGIWLQGSAARRAVHAVSEPVFRSVYDIPVYQALYDSGGSEMLRPGDPLRDMGSSNPKPPLAAD